MTRTPSPIDGDEDEGRIPPPAAAAAAAHIIVLENNAYITQKISQLGHIYPSDLIQLVVKSAACHVVCPLRAAHTPRLASTVPGYYERKLKAIRWCGYKVHGLPIPATASTRCSSPENASSQAHNRPFREEERAPFISTKSPRRVSISLVPGIFVDPGEAAPSVGLPS